MEGEVLRVLPLQVQVVAPLRHLQCYDQGLDLPARLLTSYDYGTPEVSLHISHGQLSQSA